MFPTLGLFVKLPCPEQPICKRVNCVYSHDPKLPQAPSVYIPVERPATAKANLGVTAVASSPSSAPQPRPSVVPTKRLLPSSAAGPSNGKASPSREPPSKLQRVGPSRTPNAIPTGIQTKDASYRWDHPNNVILTVATLQNGVPILKVNAAQSKVAIILRQVCIETSIRALNLRSQLLVPNRQ